MRLGNYEWDPDADLIAAGAFAEVFRARDMNTAGRTVALKIYKEAVAKGSSGSSGQKKYTLEQEFRNVDGLSHTNIIAYYGLDYIHGQDAMGRQTSHPVLVMEYAEDGTLTDFLKTHPDEMVRDKLIRDIIQGIGYLHGEGILHRDLKPGNILITKNRRGEPVAKITDFGISRDLLTNKTLEQSYTEGVGTPNYMAPEQFFKKTYGLNGELSERTDLWAVGVIVYRMLTGRLPFGEGEQDLELVRDAITGEDPDFNRVPVAYRGLLEKCLAKNAADRVGSATALLGLLDGGDSAPSPSAPSQGPGKGTGEADNSRDELPTMPPSQGLSENPPPEPSSRKEATGDKGAHSKRKQVFYIFCGFLVLLGIIGYDKWGKTYHYSGITEGLAPVMLGGKLGFSKGKWGFEDASGRQVVPFKYDGVGYPASFSEGLVAVKLGGKWGFVDKSGREAVPLKYDDARSFSEGFARVKLGGKYGFVDKFGSEAVPLKYQFAYSFSEGLAAVRFDGKWGFVDKLDNEVVPFKYDDIHYTHFQDQPGFSEGLAAVRLDGKWGFVDKLGREVIPFKYDGVYLNRGFSDGLVSVELDGKWGFVNKSGEKVIPFKYEAANSFSEGLAPVKFDGKWGFLDKSGEEAIQFKYEDASSFSEGLAQVKLGGKYGFVDKSGREVVPIKYDVLSSFSDGYAHGSLDGLSKWRYVDKSGREMSKRPVIRGK